MAGDRAEPAERRGVTVEHGDQPATRTAPRRAVARCGFLPRDLRPRWRRPRWRRPPGRRPRWRRSRAAQAALQPACRRSAEVIGEQADVAAILGHQPDRRRSPRARPRRCRRRRSRRWGPARAASSRRRRCRRPARGSSGAAACSIGARRQPQVDRAARRRRAGAEFADRDDRSPSRWMWSKRPAQDDRQLVDEGRLEAGEPVLRHADQAASRSTDARHLRARASPRTASLREDEAGVLVAGGSSAHRGRAR